MTTNDVIVAHEILGKYTEKEDEKLWIESDHDVVWITNGVTPDVLSPEDAAKMDEAGWFWGREYDCWSHFC